MPIELAPGKLDMVEWWKLLIQAYISAVSVISEASKTCSWQSNELTYDTRYIITLFPHSNNGISSFCGMLLVADNFAYKSLGIPVL